MYFKKPVWFQYWVQPFSEPFSVTHWVHFCSVEICFDFNEVHISHASFQYIILDCPSLLQFPEVPEIPRTRIEIPFSLPWSFLANVRWFGPDPKFISQANVVIANNKKVDPFIFVPFVSLEHQYQDCRFSMCSHHNSYVLYSFWIHTFPLVFVCVLIFDISKKLENIF